MRRIGREVDEFEPAHGLKNPQNPPETVPAAQRPRAIFFPVCPRAESGSGKPSPFSDTLLGCCPVGKNGEVYQVAVVA